VKKPFEKIERDAKISEKITSPPEYIVDNGMKDLPGSNWIYSLLQAKPYPFWLVCWFVFCLLWYGFIWFFTSRFCFFITVLRRKNQERRGRKQQDREKKGKKKITQGSQKGDNINPKSWSEKLLSPVLQVVKEGIQGVQDRKNDVDRKKYVTKYSKGRS